MRGVAEFAALGAFGTLAYAIYTAMKGAAATRRSRRLSEQPWTVEDADDDVGQCRVVRVVRPGEHGYTIGPPIPLSLPAWEFDEALIERQLEAQSKADALNRRTAK